ncbi:hypothetical protein BKA69DRAFT_353020 [Paraphysoderma sedebokerense]|nr:hypothetical protein BKA69DRAFT_353020 [Paraphysoderma sedebokerense]
MRKKSGPTDVAEKEPYLVPVLPVVRYESAKLTIKGEKVVTQNGTYVLYFGEFGYFVNNAPRQPDSNLLISSFLDNSFSMNTSKKLTFFVALKDGEPVTHEHKPELSGYMLKKKRKKMQGWARRWFVIDRGQLSYYVVPNGVCRGSVPIALSTISVDKQRMWINILFDHIKPWLLITFVQNLTVNRALLQMNLTVTPIHYILTVQGKVT